MSATTTHMNSFKSHSRSRDGCCALLISQVVQLAVGEWNHLPGQGGSKGDIEHLFICLKAGPRLRGGVMGRIIRWSPDPPPHRAPPLLTPPPECGQDLWIWWNIPPVIRLPVGQRWVNQKWDFPGWAWPNQASLSKKMHFKIQEDERFSCWPQGRR